MREKQLTVTIPAYNAEAYIRECLDSFFYLPPVSEELFSGSAEDQNDQENADGFVLPENSRTDEQAKCSTVNGVGLGMPEDNRIDNRLDIIVIDDGSTDRTAAIAGEYAGRFPDIIRVISKENGGHGSGINTGIANARGRYFKVVDSDDTVETQNLKTILDILEQSDSDAVVTGYKSFNEKNGKEQIYQAEFPADYSDALQLQNKQQPRDTQQAQDIKNTAQAENTKHTLDKRDTLNIQHEFTARTVSMEVFSECFEKIPASFQFHGLCYRTEFYRSLNLKLTEKVSYEDQEYAVLPFTKAQTITFIPHIFYIYRLGQSGQSVSYANQEKHLVNMRTVIENMIAEKERRLDGDSDASRTAREKFFLKRLSIAVVSYYAVALVKAGNKKSGRQAAEDFRNYLKKTDPELAANTDDRYHTLFKAGKVPGLAALYQGFSDSGFYQKFKKSWNS